MTTAEVAAYNRGIAAVAALALASAAAIGARLLQKPTRYSFAVAALEALAEGAAALALQQQADDTQGNRNDR